MGFMYFSIKYRYSDDLLKKNINVIYNVLCSHGFCDASVTFCQVSVTLSKYILDVHPRSDSTEFHGIGRGSSDLHKHDILTLPFMY